MCAVCGHRLSGAPAVPVEQIILTDRLIKLLVSVCVGLPATASFAEDLFELDTIVVTAPYGNDPIWTSPRSVSVITARDIKNSSAGNLVDLLSREANINLRSFFGQSKFANVDIRSMGETSASNVIVQVDGFRLNTSDLAGADLSSLPLSQVDRIEIFRGANGVRYGNGAVGGVINIITKKADDHLTSHAEVRRASFDSNQATADINLAGNAGMARLNAAYSDSDGYRENNASRTHDLSARINVQPLAFLDLDLRVSYHDDYYGMPGPVSLADFETEQGRKSSKRPHDFSETIDRRYQALLEVDLEDYGVVSVRAHTRNRDNPFVLGFSDLLSINDQKGVISEKSTDIALEYSTEFMVADFEQGFHWGLTGFFSDYSRSENGSQVPNQSRRTEGDVAELAGYIALDAQLGDHFLLNTGFRMDRFKVKRQIQRLVQLFSGFTPTDVQWQTGLKNSSTWYNHAAEIGFSWLASDATTVYLNYARSFRNPNIDELTLSAPDLSPQAGQQLEAGLRYRLNNWLESSLSLFHIINEDEIFFGEEPATGQRINRNFDDKTLRTGGELEIKLRPTDYFYLWGNISYTDAYFETTGNTIPHTPKLQANVGFEWTPTATLNFSLTTTYKGSRFDGNDLSNTRYEKLDAYSVTAAKLAWEYKSFRLFAGVNNLFNEIYTTVGFSENYYPMPERQFYAGLSFTHIP